MKYSVFTLIAWVAFSFAIKAPIPKPTEKWFDQNLDHFNKKTIPLTFKQRYFVYDGFYKDNGPIFFYSGNEEPLESFYYNTGLVFETAPQHGALIIFGEHRYYGKTLPFGSKSFEKENIGYLSIEQALADYALLLEEVKKDYKTGDVPIITFGGSYGGMLSAWFRLKYPNIITGAIASSAPVRMAGPDVNYSFWKRVTDTFDQSLGCVSDVRQAFSDLMKLVKQEKYEKLSKSFNLCDTLKPNQLDHLIMWVANAFGFLAMMDYPYPSNFLKPLPAWPVKYACSKLQAEPTPLQGLAEAAGFWYNATAAAGDNCFDIFEEYVQCADQTGCGVSDSAWDYQTCSEITFYPSTNGVTDMFPKRLWDFEVASKYCQDKWGVTPDTQWAHIQFATVDKDWKHASNIVFSSGSLDPWGLDLSPAHVNDKITLINIEQGAHHLDLRSSNKNDPESVRTARIIEQKMIEKWIKEFYE
eukprot:TRINITY_DN63486_c0_g1_i1.p1 TRINITY_DN63486_c0_g1~~TRINITY_DN63486_c0_g1_i1.p1  ORF type:complete len:470 (+),score=95.65 TRINITY_DN63486_c0_g1_i1:60-1469(+)